MVAFHLFTGAAIFILVAAPFGAFSSWWVLLAVPVAVLTGLAFAVPTFALSARLENDNGFSILFRFVVTPLMLFSGTFFPVDQLPVWMQPLAWVTPLWHGVTLCRDLTLGDVSFGDDLAHLGYLLACVTVGLLLARMT